MTRSRRQILCLTGAAIITATAGCQSLGPTDDAEDDNSPPEENNTEQTDQNQTETSPETDTPVDRPNEYLMTLVPGENPELRQRIPQEQLTKYQQEHGANIITESSIFSENPGEEWRQKKVDLLGLEWLHDNDYENFGRDEAAPFVESIGADSPEGSISFEAKNNPRNLPYPNSNGKSNTYGNFDYEEFSNSDSVGEALDWVQSYLFNWQRLYDNPGPISTEDALYAAVLQEGLDTHTDIESHFWSFDLPEASRSTHGNGLVYDKSNNELRVMETIAGPVTQDSANGEPQYHPRVEDSNYLDEEHHAYNQWWHPLRFAEDHQQDTLDRFHDSLDFKERKEYAASLIMGMSTGGHEGDVEPGSLTDVGATTEYVTDLTEKLRNWNQNKEYDQELFRDIKSQSKVWQKLANEEDENYVIYGTADDPKYAKVESTGIVSQIWEDQEGEFDDFEQHLEPANS